MVDMSRPLKTPSQDLLDETDSAALYVFKGAMRPRAVTKRLDQILNRSSSR